nr:tyrosine-type recombinase/integrase [Thalassotalea mangrovi]
MPKAIQHLVIDAERIDISLNTADINVARKRRDIINGRLAKLELDPLSTPQKVKNIVDGDYKNAENRRERFIQLVNTMEKDKQEHPVDWDLPYDTDRADQVFLDAYQTVNGSRNFRYKYKVTIKESLKDWVENYENRRKPDHVGKVKKSVVSFLEYLDVDNILLEDINSKIVMEYIDFMLDNYKKTTVQGYISRLKGIWKYSKKLNDVAGDCPFDGHEFYSEDEVDKADIHTPEAMQWMKNNLATSEPNKRLLFELGVFTGCRISELCNLRVKNIVTQGDIIAIDIEKGKNSSATRTIPLTTELGLRVKSHAESKQDDDLLLDLTPKDASRWFSRIKRANISTDRTKCFHSFRAMFSTALQRAEVNELKAAALVGHARGKTMTYGYYSRGYELEQLKEAYDQCIPHLTW